MNQLEILHKEMGNSKVEKWMESFAETGDSKKLKTKLLKLVKKKEKK